MDSTPPPPREVPFYSVPLKGSITEPALRSRTLLPLSPQSETARGVDPERPLTSTRNLLRRLHDERCH